MLVRGRSSITDAILKTHMPPKNLLVITSMCQYALCLELVTVLAKHALTHCACSVLQMISKKCTRQYLKLAIKPFKPPLDSVSAAYSPSAERFSVAAEHRQLTIDTNIYYTHRHSLIRDFMRHVT